MKYIPNLERDQCPACGEEYHEQLIELDNMIVCPTCWPEIARGNELCQVCGEPVAVFNGRSYYLCGEHAQSEREDAA